MSNLGSWCLLSKYHNSNIPLLFLAEMLCSVFLLLCICATLIGTPIFFMGCNEKLTSFCPAYIDFPGKVYAIQLEEDQCGKSKTNHEGDACWYTYARAAKYNSQGETIGKCKYFIAGPYYSKTKAERVANERYMIGEDIDWYKEKGNDTCHSKTYAENLWWMGLVLLCIAAFNFCGFLVTLAWAMYDDNYRKRRRTGNGL